MHEREMPLFDICEARHRGNSESQDANPATAAKRDAWKRILAALAIKPATSKELAEELGYGDQIHRISGRLSELKAMKEIVKTGVRREGAAELSLSK